MLSHWALQKKKKPSVPRTHAHCFTYELTLAPVIVLIVINDNDLYESLPPQILGEMLTYR